jgi:predicted RNase H-like nuclease
MSDSRKPHPKTTLLIRFDSAWTPKNRGAIIGVVRKHDGTFRELTNQPQIANFIEAANMISEWRRNECPAATIVLLDQPTIVKNATGQRPVQNIITSPVSLRYGGMQPASISRSEMFGPSAPVWQFLNQFGGATDPLSSTADTKVFETYPELAMMALEWVLPDTRVTGRLPKYNPERRKTFSIDDWRYVCKQISDEIAACDLSMLSAWLIKMKSNPSPSKVDQDCLDACICLLVALHLAEFKDCLMVGDTDTGYIVAPLGDGLRGELVERCGKTNRDPSKWVRIFNLNTVQQSA